MESNLQAGSSMLADAVEIARQAGDLVLHMQEEGYGHVGSKSNEFDIVTAADLASEELIRNALEERHPGIPFWGEESNQMPDSEQFWIVDPIDGTVNYANHIPCFAVNIALFAQHDVVLAVTLELPGRRIYWAEKGRGAYQLLPGGAQRRLQVNQIDSLRKAVISTGFPYTRAETRDNNQLEFDYFLPRVSGIRRMGSCAIDLALVAAGAFAAHWELNLNPWDIGPGALLIREAGGRVSDYAGADWSMQERNFVASNGRPALHDALLAGIREARKALEPGRIAGNQRTDD